MNRFDCFTSEDPTFTLPESVSIAYDAGGVSVFKSHGDAVSASPVSSWQWKDIRGFRSCDGDMEDEMGRLQIDVNLGPSHGDYGSFEFECEESPRNVELMNATLQLAVSEHQKKETDAALQLIGVVDVSDKKKTALELIRESPKYSIYNMMLKMGLPSNAVRHKMVRSETFTLSTPKQHRTKEFLTY
jgi:hypothetical protein